MYTVDSGTLGGAPGEVERLSSGLPSSSTASFHVVGFPIKLHWSPFHKSKMTKMDHMTLHPIQTCNKGENIPSFPGHPCAAPLRPRLCDVKGNHKFSHPKCAAYEKINTRNKNQKNETITLAC